MSITFRQECVDDYEQIERVIKEAFKTTPVRSGSEGRMVRKLRKESIFNPKYARVAIQNNEVVGHVILSKVNVINEFVNKSIVSIGLVSVTPNKQRQGIGKALIDHVLLIAKDEGEEAVIVLGHPSYYSKLNFKRASTMGLTLPFEAPEEAFFALELIADGLKDTSGIVEYSPAFYGV